MTATTPIAMPTAEQAAQNMQALFDQMAERYMTATGSNKQPFGITPKMLAHWLNRGSVSMDAVKGVTVHQAKQILYEDFWRPIAGDKLAPELASLLFDVAIQRGTPVASKLLQRAIKAAAKVNIKIDGEVAGQTLMAIAEHGDVASIAARIIEQRSTLVWRLGDGLIFGRKPLAVAADLALLAGRLALTKGL